MTSNGSAKKKPTTGRTTPPTKARNRAKGRRTNPRVRLDIFAEKQSILFIVDLLGLIIILKYGPLFCKRIDFAIRKK
jgi:hypothetical protein